MAQRKSHSPLDIGTMHDGPTVAATLVTIFTWLLCVIAVGTFLYCDIAAEVELANTGQPSEPLPR